ncbi:MAG TPA: NifB/NifX family molybdenum-iron cluster-binding protein [Candidatus Limnocylindrales bacterium]
MRLLIPTTDTNGAEAQLSGHFGRAPFYAIADTEADTIVVVENPSVSHGHGECVRASQAFGEGGYDAVVCQGIGGGAIARLAEAGIPVFKSDGPDVASAIASFRRSSLHVVGPEDSCAGSGGSSCGGKGHNHEDN